MDDWLARKLGLPEGFSVTEDANNMFLYYKGKHVATFQAHADAEKIKKAAKDYLLQHP